MVKVHLPSQKPLFLSMIVIGLLVLFAIPSYYFYGKYQKSQQLLKNPTEAAKEEISSLTKQVGRLIELPNEEPTVATISDKDKLKDQPFFAKAQNGDKVLIYTQARKAILYRPTADKIIEVSTVNIGPNTATSSAQTSTNTKLAIYNGTNTTGLTSTVEKQLKDKLTNVEVVVKENAKKKDYVKTTIVALTQGRDQEAKQLAEFLGGQVSTLPTGEAKPEADILIILGSDYLKK